jgi:protein-S-isoprenylcysteine O-methyltransferase Ste14
VLTHASPIAQSVGMLRWKTVLIAAVCGAAVAVLFTSTGFHTIISGPFFARDSTLLSHRALYYACLGCWVIFSLYWENAAKNSAPAKSSEAKTSRGVHVFLTNVALVLIAAPIHGFGRFVPARPLVMAAGLALEIAGLSLAIWARRHLGRNWSGEITIKQEHQLIRTGPYQHLRHPIYTGLLTMYVGMTVATGEWLGLLGLAVGFFAYWRKTRMEEATLGAAFGAEYDSYRADTWAIVPGIL